MAGVRRTWDKEAYEVKAKERLERGEDVEEVETKSNKNKRSREEFAPAEEGAEGPMGSERAFLKARQGPIDLESKVGKTEMINPTTTEGASSAGFWCEVCSCLLKDSTSYLDHINGKKHQRALGFSMRVERASTDQVKNRIDMLKQKINAKKNTPEVSAIDSYESRLATQALEAERLKKQRREEANARRREKEAADMEEVDPEIAAILGFGGFGSSKNK